MIIKKTFQGAVPDSKVFNTNSNSQVDTYSCDKINRLIRSSGGGSATSYSTEEQVVGTWIDERPVYAKTVVVENDSNSTLLTLNHGIENLNEIIDVRGSVQTYTAWKPLQNVYTPEMTKYNVTIYNIEPKKGTFNILIGTMVASEKGFSKANITFYYTKTTD